MARDPEYLRTQEVADMLSVSPKTISRWAKDGKIPFSRTLGGHRRFRRTEIEEFVANLQFHPGGDAQ